MSLSLAFAAACTSSPDPVEISQTTEMEATVVNVNADERLLALRGPDGNEVALRVGPDVRNLGQVEVGDTLNVSYYSGYVMSMAEPGDAGVDGEIAAGRAAEGERPGGMVGTTMRATVEILSVDKEGKAVSFRDSEGRIQSIRVQREEAQEFAKRLSQGDMVDVRYSEAMAVSINETDSGS